MKNEIEIDKFPVPQQMLIDAENNPKLKGKVLSKIGRRVSISVAGSVVGFFTPGKALDGSWVSGPIYIDSKNKHALLQ